MKTRKLALIVILAFTIKFWVFKPYVVTSNSMNSTLKQGDYLIVNKWENSILGNHVKPKKDDVIAFHYPLDKGDIADKLVYIKRCVGEPGDTIIVRNGKVNSAEQSLLKLLASKLSQLNRCAPEKELPGAHADDSAQWFVLSLNFVIHP